MHLKKLTLSAGIFAGVLSVPASAVEYDVGGYISLAVGKVVSGDREGSSLAEWFEYDCPCFIADYEEVGIYEDGPASFKPDSGFGLSVTAAFSDSFSLTAQAEGKGGNNFEPDLSALYLRYNVNENLSLDLGRKPLPLYYYSDFINVSYAYPWIRVSGDVYGWPLSSYNGISGAFTDDMGDGSYTVSFWYGEEEDKFNRAYNDIYWGDDKFSIKWSDILGLAFEYNYDWISLRAVVMTSKDDEVVYGEVNDEEDDVVDGKFVVSDNVDQNFYGVAAVIDYNNILLQAEYNEFDADDYESKGYLWAAGYRYGALTPMISFSRFHDADPDFGNQINHTVSYSLRWDFYRSAAFTIQYDTLSDKTKWDDDGDLITFTGDSKVIAMGVDYVF